MSYLQSAFEAVCKEAKPTESHYVCLMEQVTYYGGPEEGGWYGHDSVCVAYQEFPTEALASAAAEQVKALAVELSNDSRREYGECCLREMEWLDARGLEADWLPERDESEFYVWVGDHIPEASIGPRHYE